MNRAKDILVSILFLFSTAIRREGPPCNVTLTSTGNQFRNDGRGDGFSAQNDFLVHNSRHHYKKNLLWVQKLKQALYEATYKKAPSCTSC